jgi:hypothetical protein
MENSIMERVLNKTLYGTKNIKQIRMSEDIIEKYKEESPIKNQIKIIAINRIPLKKVKGKGILKFMVSKNV